MSKLTRNNFIAVLFVILVWGLMIGGVIGSTGCAGKGLQVEYTDGEGKVVTVDTDYQVENGFTMERDGDGYKIDLGSATTKDAEMGFMVEMMRMVMAIYAGQAPPPPAQADPAQADPAQDDQD